MAIKKWLGYLLGVDQMDLARAEAEARRARPLPPQVRSVSEAHRRAAPRPPARPLTLQEADEARQLDVLVDWQRPDATREAVDRRRRHRLADSEHPTAAIPQVAGVSAGYDASDGRVITARSEGPQWFTRWIGGDRR